MAIWKAHEIAIEQDEHMIMQQAQPIPKPSPDFLVSKIGLDKILSSKNEKEEFNPLATT